MCIGRSDPSDRLPQRAGRDVDGSSQLTELQKRFVPAISGRREQLSQSRIAGRKKPSSACTIIAVKLAEAIYRQGLHVAPIFESSSSFLAHSPRKDDLMESTSTVPFCSSELTNAFLNAIIEGNEIHSKLTQYRRKKEDPQSDTFTIPRALQGCGNVFKEIQYVSVRGRLIDNIGPFLVGPIKSNTLADHQQIFMLLIAYERAILLLYDRENDTVGLMDSHAHLNSYLSDGGERTL
ncbi:unnamed protein product [Toxocara canis]|uniref:DNA helicase n=1 Tax=Toxocara canis TaxID=6265 RepID=A0A183UJT3_TOXCA|nr:unnamed protein product [Toxocara canis]